MIEPLKRAKENIYNRFYTSFCSKYLFRWVKCGDVGYISEVQTRLMRKVLILRKVGRGKFGKKYLLYILFAFVSVLLDFFSVAATHEILRMKYNVNNN